MINALLSLKLNQKNGYKPTNPTSPCIFVKHICVSNACNMDFLSFIVLGDELLIACIYFALY